MIYYVDNACGNNEGGGRSPQQAVRDYTRLSLQPGDSLLFKRGSVYHGELVLTLGQQGAPITYGAYGEGEAPVFTGGTDVSAPEDWAPTPRQNVWKCLRHTHGQVGNFVFDGDPSTAALRWTAEELGRQGDFFDDLFVQDYSGRPFTLPQREGHVYLYSEGNPATVYRRIVAVDYRPCLCTLRDHVVLDGLCFQNNSVHALAGGGGRDVTVRNCHFENIGGCVWSHALRIRLGNAVEFWDVGEDVLVEHCTFKNIFDSCVTHQGPGDKTRPAVNFTVRHCLFENYGMAAFEYRDKVPVNAVFAGNTCLNAGVGFAVADGELPRRSEIWPQPMGHHLFLWRLEQGTQGGSILVENNVFGPAPIGAAVYSVASPEAEAQVTLRNNRYTPNATLLIRWDGRDFHDLDTYRRACGQDEGSVYGE